MHCAGIFRVTVCCLLVFLAGCSGQRFVKIAPDLAQALLASSAAKTNDYQAMYSGVIEIDNMKLAVRFLAAFYGEKARFEILPTNGAISIFSMAKRGNVGEILLPSVAKGAGLSDIRELLMKEIRTADFVRYLPALLQNKLPADCQALDEKLVCSADSCRLGESTEIFDIDRRSAAVVKAVFRDRFQLTDRVVLEMMDDRLNISIPEVAVKLRLVLEKREPLMTPSERRFVLKIPEDYSPL